MFQISTLKFTKYRKDEVLAYKHTLTWGSGEGPRRREPNLVKSEQGVGKIGKRKEKTAKGREKMRKMKKKNEWKMQKISTSGKNFLPK